ncbi:MAG: glycosyltransferase [Rhodothermales bacterium]
MIRPTSSLRNADSPRAADAFLRESADPKGAAPTDPTVSVVITTYNHARYLRDAVESVRAQTFGDFEILVIDDGSTDATPEVAACCGGIRYLRQHNQGLSAARNAGLRESRGRFLVFLDADDRLLPGALAAGLNCFSAYSEAAFVFGRYRQVSETGELLSQPVPPPVRHSYYNAFLGGNLVGMHATVMYRRVRLREIGGFDVTLPACEDYDVYLRMTRRFDVAMHDEAVADYRMHDANMSRNIALMLSSALRVLRKQRAHARRDARRQASLEQGLRQWRRYYGEKMMPYLGTLRNSAGPGVPILKAAWHLLRSDPATFAASVLSEIERRVGGQLTGVVKRFVRRSPSTGAGRQSPSKARRPFRTTWPSPPVGTVRFGDFRRITPMSTQFGFDRGCPIDRYYIEAFLHRHASAIRGRVLEVGDDAYTKRFGGDRVVCSDVLHVTTGHPKATFIDDLSSAKTLPSNAFDCVILTQTLHLIYDVRAALANLYRILKPGGVLLMTVPGSISQLEQGTWKEVWCWGFTELSIRKLCGEAFETSPVEIVTSGSVLTAISFLHGLAASELEPSELDYHDPLYPLLISVRIRKPDLPEDAPGASNV